MDYKKPVEIVCLSVKEFLAMDLSDRPDPAHDHPGYDIWKSDQERSQKIENRKKIDKMLDD
tara:strand:- start:1564 stop:1746 length:183 start_codon:yes stop_codon:yes gene_type:complete